MKINGMKKIFIFNFYKAWPGVFCGVRLEKKNRIKK